MNDDFTTIVDAVEEGRRTYANVQMYVGCYLTMCLPEVAMYGICLVAGLPMPLSQLQILGLNGIGKFIPPLMFAFQPSTEDSMLVPPRRKDSKLLPRATMLWITIAWLLIFLPTWLSLHVLSYWMHTGYIFTDDLVAAEGTG